MRQPIRTLLIGGTVHSRVEPFASALLIDDDRILWVGDDAGARVHYDIADAVVDLKGAFLAPGFVDSHIHATSTGLTLTGLDLSGVRSAQELLDAVRARAQATKGATVFGHGWDETSWSDPTLPTRTELDRAAWGSEVYLSRIDVHSAVVSSALIAGVDDISDLDGFSVHGPVTRDAHSRIRRHAFERITNSQRETAQRATLDDALAHGIVAVHEMGGPSIGGHADARALASLAKHIAGPRVAQYWGELASAEALAFVAEIDAVGLGGDLFVDGSLGSHTAALAEPYADADTRGALYLDEDAITNHVRACVDKRIPSGFHVIGDHACRTVAKAICRVAEEQGADQLRSVGTRLEHAEMLSGEDIEALSRVGTTFSMQPIFDARWGQDGGMYESRLGLHRSRGMNRLADVIAAGGRLAINSDSPVTAMRPWSAIRAATEHSNPEQAISARAAFAAHTRGGWAAAGDMQAGVIAPGAPAHLAVWEVEELEVRVPDHRVQGWSTDPRAGTPGLPDLASEDPRCLATVVDGQCRYGQEYWEESRAR